MAETGLKAEVLQAVLLADDQQIHSISRDAPLGLLRVGGVALLQYSLEALSRTGIQETFLFCTSHIDTVKNYISDCVREKAAWSVNMVVHVIASETCRSLGDALRDLDAKGLIRGYFILTAVNTIFNVQLLPLLEKHKEICNKDKGAVMTLIYKSVLPGHRAKKASPDVLLAANSKSNRVLFHQKSDQNIHKRKESFPIEMFLENANVSIRSDLLDVNIAICSPAVLPLFADNFDFQTRDDFVKGILMNEEILASSIYWHQLTGDQYAACVSNWQSYQTISQDILHRWTYPLVPDKLSRGSNHYMLLRNHVYRSRDVTLGKGCELKEEVLIAEKCTVKEKTRIERSVIGKNCHIGNNCQIINSYLLGDIKIGDGCLIESSVINENCVVKENCKIISCILFSNVQLDKSTEVDLLHLQKTKSSSNSRKICESAYTVENDDDNESMDSEESVQENHDVNDDFLISKWWDENSEGYSSSSDEESSRAASPVMDDTNLFLQEVVDSLARGYEDKLNCDYLILEINSSRYAYNIALQEVNFFVIRALFSLPPMKTSSSILQSFKDLLGYFTPIIANYIKGSDAMMDCLRAVEESCINDEALNNRTGQIIHLLYDKDVIEEEIILKWFGEIKKDKSPLCQESALLKFIEWLQQASEESEESDE